MTEIISPGSGLVENERAPYRYPRLVSLARMGRLVRKENFIGTLIAAGLVAGDEVRTVRGISVLVLTLVSYMGWVAVAGIWDDIQGCRDGSDLLNYQRSHAAGLRAIGRKPMLNGWITEREAIAGSMVALAVALATGAGAWLVAGGGPVAPLVASQIVLALGTQYSAGLKLSYRGLQEATLLAVMITSVLYPVALLSERVDAGAVGIATVFGMWFVQVSMCSNMHDIEGDRAAHRWTMAALLPNGAHRALIHVWAVLAWALVIVLAANEAIMPWVLIPGVLVAAHHLRQLAFVRAGNPLQARLSGFDALRFGSIGLALGAALENWR